MNERQKYVEPVKVFMSELRSLRKEAGMTQEDVSSQLPVSRTAISLYECGKMLPSHKVLKKLAKIFKYDLPEKVYGSKRKAVFIPDKCRKQIVVDEPVKKFLASLNELCRSMSVTPAELSRELGITASSLREYIGGDLVPSLRKLKILGEYFCYDLSDSVNIRYTKENCENLKEKLRQAEISQSDLEYEINYSRGQISATLNYHEAGSVVCYAAIESYVEGLPSGMKRVTRKIKHPVGERCVTRKRKDISDMLSFKQGMQYRIETPRRGPSKVWYVMPSTGEKCIFRYEGKSGEHYLFREVTCGWMQTYTAAQLVGKQIQEVCND